MRPDSHIFLANRFLLKNAGELRNSPDQQREARPTEESERRYASPTVTASDACYLEVDHRIKQKRRQHPARDMGSIHVLPTICNPRFQRLVRCISFRKPVVSIRFGEEPAICFTAMCIVSHWLLSRGWLREYLTDGKMPYFVPSH
jgi:hypothetical protein